MPAGYFSESRKRPFSAAPALVSPNPIFYGYLEKERLHGTFLESPAPAATEFIKA